MAKPRAPENFFVNRTSSQAILVWDKVVKDLDLDYTTVTAYYVYRTLNPARRDWQLLKKVITNDKFVDKDVFCIDFSPANYLYRICAENAEGIGPCAVSYGIISTVQEIVTPTEALWDVALWGVDY